MTIEELEEEAGGSRAGMDADFLVARLKDDANAAYDRREEELGTEGVRQLERMVLLQVIDRKWREHLYEMDYLQEGINLRAYAQRDPVVEYQREGFDMFATMMDGIKEETVGFLYNVDVQVTEPEPEAGADEVTLLDKPVEIRAKGLNQAPRRQGLQYSAPTIDGEASPGAVAVEQAEQQAPALGWADRPRVLRRHRGRAHRPPRSGRHPGCGPGGSVGRRPSAGTEPGGGQQRPVPQRAVPVWLGPQVQALPRCPQGGMAITDQQHSAPRVDRRVPADQAGTRRSSLS